MRKLLNLGYDTSRLVKISPPSGTRYNIQFSGNISDSIFSKELLPMPLPVTWNSSSIKDNYEAYNDYTLNNYNYRGPDFSSNYDILTAGCSQTFGIGVPDNGPWPVHLSEMMIDTSYVNLSMPGASIEWIVDSIYRYINTFGKPKRGIAVLFPDLFRHDVLINSISSSLNEKTESDFIPQITSEDGMLKLLSLSLIGNIYPSYLKKPYPVEYTTTLEESIKSSIQKVKDLEIFCRFSNIPLIWSSWSDSFSWLMESIPEKYKFNDYIRLYELTMWKSHLHELPKTKLDPEGIVDYKIWHSEDTMSEYGCSKELFDAQKCICFLTCHFDREIEFPMSFHAGTDRFKKSGSHYGVHQHIHIAQQFFNRIKEMGI